MLQKTNSSNYGARIGILKGSHRYCKAPVHPAALKKIQSEVTHEAIGNSRRDLCFLCSGGGDDRRGPG
jgi:hypothetical protein